MKLSAKTQSGFTLLELLMVLALTVSLSLAGLAIYQQQLKNFKQDKTALQMQQWLQAGMNFYIDCNVWPNPANDPNIIQEMTGVQEISTQACPALQSPVSKAYMPTGSDSNGPWPNSYMVNIGQGPESGMFVVSTYLGADSPALEIIGNSIAARLPNAKMWVNENTNLGPQVEVDAYVNAPTPPVNQQGYILDMEMVNSSGNGTVHANHLKMPTTTSCPANMQAVLVGAMSGYQSNTDYNGRVGIYSSALNGITMNNGFITSIGTTSNGLVEPDLHAVDVEGKGQDSGSNQVLMITACLPKTAMSTNGSAANGNNSANSQNNQSLVMASRF